ncbi:MFS transporter [Nocardia panacis]|nr:MFS transporter [Nocardia panacis]
MTTTYPRASTSRRNTPEPARPRSHWSATTALALTSTVAIVPIFALGAMATRIQPDLGLTRTDIGLAISAFYATAALGSPLAKRIAARLPPPAVLAVSAISAAAAAAVIATAHTFATLLAALVIAGFTNGLIQPVAGRVLIARVPVRRHSLVAGIVGSALGAAAFIPGVLVTYVVDPYGWRPAMAALSLLALTAACLAPLAGTNVLHGNNFPTPIAAPPRAVPETAVRRVLALWAAAAALSAIGSNAIAAYFIQIGHHTGLSTGLAGKLLSACAVAAIATRILLGVVTDRAPHRNAIVVACLMGAGACGLVLIATGGTIGFIVGAVLAFSIGSGWTALLVVTTLALVPGRAEQAGAVVQMGLFSGFAAGPFTYGALSATLGFDTAAALAAAAGLLATLLMLLGARHARPARA